MAYRLETEDNKDKGCYLVSTGGNKYYVGENVDDALYLLHHVNDDQSIIHDFEYGMTPRHNYNTIIVKVSGSSDWLSLQEYRKIYDEQTWRKDDGTGNPYSVRFKESNPVYPGYRDPNKLLKIKVKNEKERFEEVVKEFIKKPVQQADYDPNPKSSKPVSNSCNYTWPDGWTIPWNPIYPQTPTVPFPEVPYVPPQTVQGWVCPKCGAGVSPFEKTCPCNSLTVTITNTTNV